MTDPIRAALEKAAEAVRVSFIEEGSCYGGDACHALPCKCASDAATKAIAAFLRALPEGYVEVRQPEGMTRQLGMNHIHARAVADAVLAAAKDQTNE